MRRVFRASIPAAVAAIAMFGLTNPLSAQFYQKTVLTSDLAGQATNLDPHLMGAWGITRSATSPWWVNSTMGGVSLLFNGSGQPIPLVVTIPGPAMGPVNQSIPTGVVFNGAAEFDVGPGQPARFIFVTRNGTIAGWNPAANPTKAITMVDNSATADYTGATIATLNGADALYVANFGQGRVDVFTTSYAPVTLAAGSFTDDDLPMGFSVFNVQLVGAVLYVTYAPKDSFGPTPTTAGQGYVDVYSPEGMLLRHLRHGVWMNAPWGVTQAPADFGKFSNDILVGMFGNGHIAAFDATSGEFRGWMRTTHGKRLTIDRGLWGLEFGNGAAAGPTNSLYFAADLVLPGGVYHGLFGTITVMPPSENGQGEDQNGG